jgi:hypothetical protein
MCEARIHMMLRLMDEAELAAGQFRDPLTNEDLQKILAFEDDGNSKGAGE